MVDKDEGPAPDTDGVSREPASLVARPGLSLGHLGTGLKAAALLLFLLPWVTISCAEQTLVELSGLDLARGSISLTNPLTGEQIRPPNDGGGNVAVQIAALLIAIALGIGLAVKRRIGDLISSGLLAVTGALLVYTILYRLPLKARTEATAGSVQGISEAQIAEMIRFEVEPGFWLVLAALAGAIVLALISRKNAPPEN